MEVQRETLERVYKIARIIAESDSIAEGWHYNKQGYSWEDFMAEKERTDTLRDHRRDLSEFDQSYYNVALRIYKELGIPDCGEPLDIPWNHS